MPSGHITAVDLSPDIVSRASAHAQEVGVASNITFQATSVYELSKTFGENVFDVVHASQMLCHLDSPVEALTQMLKVVKPGGFVALREIDMRVWSCYPDTEAMRAWHRTQLATHEAAGGSNAAGPSLVSWAMKADYSCIGVTFRDRVLNGEMRKKALELGVATEAELDEMGAEWQRWIDTEDATCGTIHGQLVITKV
jgi:ubiquinone/menaquinone biosynthesis C-methylase UbiE